MLSVIYCHSFIIKFLTFPRNDLVLSLSKDWIVSEEIMSKAYYNTLVPDSLVGLALSKRSEAKGKDIVCAHSDMGNKNTELGSNRP